MQEISEIAIGVRFFKVRKVAVFYSINQLTVLPSKLMSMEFHKSVNWVTLK